MNLFFYEWKRQECPQLADIAWLANLSWFLNILHYSSMHWTRVSKLQSTSQIPLATPFHLSGENILSLRKNLLYLRKTCWFGEMQYIPKQPHYVRSPALELLCNSLCGPQIKKFRDPCTKQTTTRCLFRKTAERMFCDIKTERKFTVGSGKIPCNWAAEIFSNSEKTLKKFYNNCKQFYKPSRKIFLTL